MHNDDANLAALWRHLMLSWHLDSGWSVSQPASTIFHYIYIIQTMYHLLPQHDKYGKSSLMAEAKPITFVMETISGKWKPLAKASILAFGESFTKCCSTQPGSAATTKVNKMLVNIIYKAASFTSHKSFFLILKLHACIFSFFFVCVIIECH